MNGKGRLEKQEEMGSPTRAILCRPHHLSTPASRSKEKAYLTRLSLKTSCQPQPLPQQDRPIHPPIPLVLMRTAQKDSSGHLLMACAPVHLSQEVSSRGLERVTRLLINVSIRLLHPPRALRPRWIRVKCSSRGIFNTFFAPN